jgi:hypothetical protein
MERRTIEMESLRLRSIIRNMNISHGNAIYHNNKLITALTRSLLHIVSQLDVVQSSGHQHEDGANALFKILENAISFNTKEAVKDTHLIDDLHRTCANLARIAHISRARIVKLEATQQNLITDLSANVLSDHTVTVPVNAQYSATNYAIHTAEGKYLYWSSPKREVYQAGEGAIFSNFGQTKYALDQVHTGKETATVAGSYPVLDAMRIAFQYESITAAIPVDFTGEIAWYEYDDPTTISIVDTNADETHARWISTKSSGVKTNAAPAVVESISTPATLYFDTEQEYTLVGDKTLLSIANSAKLADFFTGFVGVASDDVFGQDKVNVPAVVENVRLPENKMALTNTVVSGVTADGFQSAAFKAWTANARETIPFIGYRDTTQPNAIGFHMDKSGAQAFSAHHPGSPEVTLSPNLALSKPTGGYKVEPSSRVDAFWDIVLHSAADTAGGIAQEALFLNEYGTNAHPDMVEDWTVAVTSSSYRSWQSTKHPDGTLITANIQFQLQTFAAELAGANLISIAGIPAAGLFSPGVWKSYLPVYAGDEIVSYTFV